ncbi:type IV toxin-antitoxin system AbiEi family antitoxin (plasmid) [Bradyrhizobium septentrionale]|uniref:AbiEi antitoxin C-terminal domain-containing protein n=1 Tax=Bradyrhizobium septentrionale TaxID=1404411 RepID=A0A974A7C9_9BRAD|nr:type IV toxin-antitoxin system AbiEi family antitoxin [Bradyrhizobium septentrionale]UGY11954.1 type IV toxin-antitoxin system AbiEi family antitoxin [Bradyrhizobium septentrionale]UGY30155.1 type IV toxin-antitoxin system AbiEi family antitoxin [Bradyrhizobium septentrionale]
MMLNRRSTLASYLTNLLASGRVSFTRDEAIAELNTTSRGFLAAARRLQDKNALINPRQGFYVVVPPQYLARGAPPPQWYINDLMKHEGSPYYVGLLKAAEIHGASHQAVMQFQTVTDKRMPKIRAGRSILTFFYRKDLDALRAAITDHKTDTGFFKLSSPELTGLDLLRYMHVTGTIDSIATVLSDLGAKMNAAELQKLAPAFERSVIQRLGYLLDFVKHNQAAEGLHAYLHNEKLLPWVDLDPSKKASKSRNPAERDTRWNVLVHRRPELDQ